MADKPLKDQGMNFPGITCGTKHIWGSWKPTDEAPKISYSLPSVDLSATLTLKATDDINGGRSLTIEWPLKAEKPTIKFKSKPGGDEKTMDGVSEPAPGGAEDLIYIDSAWSGNKQVSAKWAFNNPKPTFKSNTRYPNPSRSVLTIRGTADNGRGITIDWSDPNANSPKTTSNPPNT